MPLMRDLMRRGMERTGDLVGPQTRRRLGRSAAAQRMIRWARAGVSIEPAGRNPASKPAYPEADAQQRPAPTGDDLPVRLMGNRPSYRYKLEELKRRHGDLRPRFGLSDPLDEINDKYQAYLFADRHGLDHPKLFGSFQSVLDVDWGTLPSSFVIKTRFGSSNHGVKALVREGQGYIDLLRSQRLSVEEIEADYVAKASAGMVSGSMFAEELIAKNGNREIADDWKFYCFDGVVGLCMQRDVRATADPSQWRFKFWDPSWRDLGPIKFVDRLDPDLEPPNDPRALLELAKKLSSIIKRPFVRIDLFESDRGPLLGEFTPRPGPPEVFVSEIDEMLGRLWEEAEQRQFAREIEGGAWDHIRVE